MAVELFEIIRFWDKGPSINLLCFNVSNGLFPWNDRTSNGSQQSFREELDVTCSGVVCGAM